MVLVYHRSTATGGAVTAGRGCDAEGAVEAVSRLSRDLLPGVGHPVAGEVGRACTMVLAMAARENGLSSASTL